MGFTLVELMVGLAIGLLVAGAALAWAGHRLGAHHRLLIEVQMQQELRAVLALVARDLRRAGTWDSTDAVAAVSDPGLGAKAVRAAGRMNTTPYPEPSFMTGPPRLLYAYARDGDDAPADPFDPFDSPARPNAANPANPAASPAGPAASPVADPAVDPAVDPPAAATTVPSLRDATGLRAQDGRLDLLLGGRHQPLVDTALMRITGFKAELIRGDHDLGDCPTSGCASGRRCRDALRVLGIRLSMDAFARLDPQVRQHAELLIRVRNDWLTESCP